MTSLSTVVKPRAAIYKMARFELYQGEWFENGIAKNVFEDAEPVFKKSAILTVGQQDGFDSHCTKGS